MRVRQHAGPLLGRELLIRVVGPLADAHAQLAEVEIDLVDAFHVFQGLDRPRVPRGCSYGVLEHEEPPVSVLRHGELDGEAHVLHAVGQELPHFGVLHANIVEILYRTEWPTHRAQYEHEGLIALQLISGPFSLLRPREVPRQPVLLVELRQV